MERRITKIKLKADLVVIQWQQYQSLTKDWDSFAMSSKEAPLPSFPEAMAALAKHVEEICDAETLPRQNNCHWHFTFL